RRQRVQVCTRRKAWRVVYRVYGDGEHARQGRGVHTRAGAAVVLYRDLERGRAVAVGRGLKGQLAAGIDGRGAGEGQTAQQGQILDGVSQRDLAGFVRGARVDADKAGNALGPGVFVHALVAAAGHAGRVVDGRDRNGEHAGQGRGVNVGGCAAAVVLHLHLEGGRAVAVSRGFKGQ